MYFPLKKVVSVLDAQMNDKLFSVINNREFTSDYVLVLVLITKKIHPPK